MCGPDRNRQYFSIKGTRVNILGFTGYEVSVVTTVT